MKAAVFHQAGMPLSVDRVDDPTPRPDEVIVRIESSGICGSDLHLTTQRAGLPPGTILGHEFSGVVVAVGGQVTSWRLGDRIAPHAMAGCNQCDWCEKGQTWWCHHRSIRGGGYGQYARVREHAGMKIPEAVTPDQGALIEPVACGLHAVKLAPLSSETRVLVIGVGPIGLSVIYWASRAGVGPIAAAARTSQRSQLAMAMGASHFLVTNEDFPESVSAVLGGPPDVVFDCVGVPGVLDLAMTSAAPRGSVILSGQCVPPDTVDHLPGMMKELHLRYSVAYESVEFEHVARVLGAGDVTLSRMITDKVSLGQFPLAFEALRHRTTQCKVLVDPWRTELAI